MLDKVERHIKSSKRHNLNASYVSLIRRIAVEYKRDANDFVQCIALFSFVPFQSVRFASHCVYQYYVVVGEERGIDIGINHLY